MSPFKYAQLLTPIWTICALYFGIAVASDFTVNKNLTVFDGTTDVTDQVFLNETDDCLDFTETFNQSFLPPVARGHSVEKPSDLQYAISTSQRFDSFGRLVLQPEISIRWMGPYSTKNRQFLKGFLVSIESDNSSTINQCYIFIVDYTAFLRRDLSFHVSYSVPEKSRLTIRVYSLPPPDKEGKDYVQFILVTTGNTVDLGLPGDWRPTIGVQPSLDDGKIDVTFTLPPKAEGWLLKQFRVLLVKLSCGRFQSYAKHKLEINTTDIGQHEAHVQFQGLENDVYNVQVGALNHEFPNTSQCVCRSRSLPQCSNPCARIRTRWFDLTAKVYGERDLSKGKNFPRGVMGCAVPVPTSTLTSLLSSPITHARTRASACTGLPTTTTTTQSTAFDTPRSRSSSKTIIAVAAVAGVVAMTLVLLAILYYFWRRKKRGLTEFNHFESQRKTAYILAVTDQRDSVLLLERFCGLLKTRCGCDVINPRDADLSQESESVWVTSQLMKCDCIIFVDSKVAQALLKVYLDKGDSCIGSNHSLFYKALTIAFNSTHLKHAFLSVTFTRQRVRDEIALFNPKYFRLPNDMPKFVRCLHGFGNSYAEKAILSHTMKKLRNLPEWQSLLDAVKQVDTFERNYEDKISTSYRQLSRELLETPSLSSSGYLNWALCTVPSKDTILKELSVAPESLVKSPTLDNPTKIADVNFNWTGKEYKNCNDSCFNEQSALSVKVYVNTENDGKPDIKSPQVISSGQYDHENPHTFSSGQPDSQNPQTNSSGQNDSQNPQTISSGQPGCQNFQTISFGLPDDSQYLQTISSGRPDIQNPQTISYCQPDYQNPQTISSGQPDSQNPHTISSGQPDSQNLHTQSSCQSDDQNLHTKSSGQPDSQNPQTISSGQPDSQNPHTISSGQPDSQNLHTQSSCQSDDQNLHTKSSGQPDSQNPHTISSAQPDSQNLPTQSSGQSDDQNLQTISLGQCHDQYPQAISSCQSDDQSPQTISSEQCGDQMPKTISSGQFCGQNPRTIHPSSTQQKPIPPHMLDVDDVSLCLQQLNEDEDDWISQHSWQV